MFPITFTPLSERCNFVKMIVTKIFMRSIFEENFKQNIFGNPRFSSKVHISRENREKVISASRFDPVHEGDRAGGGGGGGECFR